MVAVGYLVLGFAPGLFWLWLVYQRDRYLPSPVLLVIRTFLFGVLISIPILIVETLLTGFGAVDREQLDLPVVTAVYIAFVVAGFTEELGKFLVVRQSLYKSPYFSEPMDGLIFASAAALGFASIENVFYMVSFGWAIVLVRGPFSTIGHVLFAAPWGFALGKEKQGATYGEQVTWAALALGMVIHGLFNFSLFTGGRWAAGTLALFLVGVAGLFYLVASADKVSAGLHKAASVILTCPGCRTTCGSRANYCPACGRVFRSGTAEPVGACNNCSWSIRPEFSFCPSCGSSLHRRNLEPYTLVGPSS